jgi:hypothetical protein
MMRETRHEANRRNAARSTGPRTARGKRRVRRNALKHGLAANTLSIPAPQRDVVNLIAALLGKTAKPDHCELARDFVLAHFYWKRVLMLQRHLLRTHKHVALTNEIVKDKLLAALARYEQRAARSCLQALCRLRFRLS